MLADILQVAPVWVSLAGIGYFGLGAAVGLLTEIPWFYIVIGAPAAAFLFVVSTLVWMQLKRPEKPAPAIELAGWGKHPVYTVWAASNLWVGLKPNSIIPADSLAYEPLQLINSHLISGFIQSVYGETGMNAQVTRDDLIKLANHVGARPKFLFPS